MSGAVVVYAAAGLAALLVVGGPVSRRLWFRVDPVRVAATRIRAAGAVVVGLAATGVTVLSVAVFLTVGAPGLAVLAALVVAGAVVAPRTAATRRRRALDRQLGPAADAIGASCEAGLSFRSAVAAAARDLPEPIRGELVTVREAFALGARTDDAVATFAERVGGAEARLLAAVVAVQARSGGNIGSSLRRLAERMARRVRLAEELRSATAQARSTATIVSVLPLAGAVVAELASPGAVTGLLATAAGRVVVAASALVQIAGLLLIRAISRVPA